MVLQDKLDLVDYAKDIDISFNLKLFLLFTILLYSVISIWISYKWKQDNHYVNLIRIFLLRIPMMIFIYFFPLLSIFLLRTASWEIIYTFMIAFYSYSFVILLIAGKLGLFEYGAQLLGLKMSPKQMKIGKNKAKW